VRVGNREGVDRRQEEEIVAQRRSHTREQGWPKPKAHRDANHGGQKDQVDVLNTDPAIDQFTATERDGDPKQSPHIGTWLKMSNFSGFCALSWNGTVGKLVPGDDMDADIPRAAHQIVHHRPMQDFEPARTRRFSDDYLRHVMSVGVADHVVCDAAITAGDRDGFAAQCLGKPQRVGYAVALDLIQLSAAAAFDI
jgi:hypothetical protein